MVVIRAGTKLHFLQTDFFPEVKAYPLADFRIVSDRAIKQHVLLFVGDGIRRQEDAVYFERMPVAVASWVMVAITSDCLKSGKSEPSMIAPIKR